MAIQLWMAIALPKELRLMEYVQISKEDVKDFLRNRDKIKIEIYDKIYTINCDIRKTNDIIEMVSFQHAELSDMPKGSSSHKDLSDTYLKYQKILDVRSTEYSHLLYGLIQKENAVERVWLCYLVLAEPYFSILTDMYVKNQKYEVAESMSGFSRQVFEKYRKRGINLVLELYSSKKSMAELTEYGMKANEKREQVKHKDVYDTPNYQLSLEDMLKM